MSQTEVKELLVKMTADDSQFNAAMQGAAGTVKEFASTATQAIGVAAAAFTALTVRQVAVIGQFDDMAKSLGLTYDALVNMSLVAEEGGLQINQLTTALGFMQRTLYEAASGNEATIDLFNQLGLSVNELLALSPDQQFLKIAEAMSAIQNPTERTAVLMDIFGKAGRLAAQTMEDYAEKIREAEEFNRRFGISLSQIDVETIGAAEDAIKRLGAAAGGLANQFAIEVSPAITLFTKSLTENDQALGNTRSAVESFMDVVYLYIDIVKQFQLGLANTFAMMAAAFERMKGNAEGAKAIMQEVYDNENRQSIFVNPQARTRAQVDAEAQRMARQFENVKPLPANPTVIRQGSMKEMEKETKEAEKAAKELEKALEEINEKLDETRTQVADTFSDFVLNVSKGEDAFVSLKNTALSALQSIVKEMFRISFTGKSSGSGLFSMLAEGVLGGITGGFGGGSIPNPNIKGTSYLPFANGGVVSRATMFPIGYNTGVMGEAGAEAIMPLARGAGGKLGVVAHGGGGGGVNITQNLNFSMGVRPEVQAEIQRMLPQIQEASVSAVETARARGVI